MQASTTLRPGCSSESVFQQDVQVCDGETLVELSMSFASALLSAASLQSRFEEWGALTGSSIAIACSEDVRLAMSQWARLVEACKQRAAAGRQYADPSCWDRERRLGKMMKKCYTAIMSVSLSTASLI